MEVLLIYSPIDALPLHNLLLSPVSFASHCSWVLLHIGNYPHGCIMIFLILFTISSFTRTSPKKDDRPLFNSALPTRDSHITFSDKKNGEKHEANVIRARN